MTNDSATIKKSYYPPDKKNRESIGGDIVKDVKPNNAANESNSKRRKPTNTSRSNAEADSKGKRNLKLGKRGEDAAVAFLIKRGYEIVERNWKCFAGEADIICRLGQTLIFVEVKTRKDIQRGFPSEYVNHAKRSKYEKIALAYISENISEEMRIRFDIISVVAHDPKFACMRHYIDAFGVA